MAAQAHILPPWVESRPGISAGRSRLEWLLPDPEAAVRHRLAQMTRTSHNARRSCSRCSLPVVAIASVGTDGERASTLIDTTSAEEVPCSSTRSKMVLKTLHHEFSECITTGGIHPYNLIETLQLGFNKLKKPNRTSISTKNSANQRPTKGIAPAFVEICSAGITG